MIIAKRSILPYIAILLFFLNTNAQKVTHPKNEFRAVWIATVMNIDWPKVSTDSVAKQKADFIEILETYKKLNYNAVIVQIRSVGDAFYPTNMAPWSRYLTGKEGQAPKQNFDPLEWMITESHNRGFEFHAWFNPYRATFDLKTETLSPNHDYFKHPDWMIKYGDKYYYNPGLPEVQNQLTAVVEEVVLNYDIDAVHFDDYFYPYRIKNEKFNDDEAFAKYGNGLNQEDWRRANVNNLVGNLYYSIKCIKPWVQFGISPFGVWRNKSVDPRGSDTQAGQTNYDDLYADPMAWMQNKWVDYLIPQLYWSLEHPKASYSKLLKWWSENSKNIAVYIGNGSYKIKADADKKWKNPNEIPNQINACRGYSNVLGNAYFSAKSFVNKNQSVTKILSENQYKYPALPLAVPNSQKNMIDIPRVNSVIKDSCNFNLNIKLPLNRIRYIMLYTSKKTSKIDINDASQIIDKVAVKEINNTIRIAIPTNKVIKNYIYAITFIDLYGNESSATEINLL